MKPAPVKPYSVGEVIASGSVMGRFDTEEEAAEFIGTLPGHELGIYYLDGPEKATHKVYRIYLREGPSPDSANGAFGAGKYWGREFGTDYRTLADARAVKADYQAAYPDAHYFIRAARPRYRIEG